VVSGVSTEHLFLLLSRIPAAQECDATDDDSSTTAGFIKFYFISCTMMAGKVGLIFVVYRVIFVSPRKPGKGKIFGWHLIAEMVKASA
jgi:hypothetical protein